MNKYDQFTTEFLIKSIQEICLKMAESNWKKKASSTTLKRHALDLRDLRNAAILRLSKMDRSDPEFFPIDCLVLYTHPYSQKGPVTAKVLSRDGPKRKVVILLEGELDPILVEPEYLKIKFIRP